MTLRTIASGLAFGDGARWHDGRLWVSDMHAREVLRIDVSTGTVETVCSVPGSPSGLGWLPDGRLLVVSMTDRLLLRLEPAGDLVVHADIGPVATFHCNDMVVDGRGNAYVGNFGSDYVPGTKRTLADIALARPDGEVVVAARGLGFPNGSCVTPDGRTLLIAETMGRRILAFPIEADGMLGERRIWADLGRGLPDGMCLDAEGAVWYADPRARECVRVAEGGAILERVPTEDSCYCCALGGPGRNKLFVLTAGADDADQAVQLRSGRVLALDGPVHPGAGWP